MLLDIIKRLNDRQITFCYLSFEYFLKNIAKMWTEKSQWLIKQVVVNVTKKCSSWRPKMIDIVCQNFEEYFFTLKRVLSISQALCNREALRSMWGPSNCKVVCSNLECPKFFDHPTIETLWAVVVAQLTARLLPIPEDPGSNTDMSDFY